MNESTELRRTFQQIIDEIFSAGRKHKASDAKLLCRASYAIFRGIDKDFFEFTDASVYKNLNFLLKKAKGIVGNHPDVDVAVTKFRLWLLHYLSYVKDLELIEKKALWLFTECLAMYEAGLLRVSWINSLFRDANEAVTEEDINVLYGEVQIKVKESPYLN